MIIKKILTFLIAACALPFQLSAQCGDAANGTSCANTTTGDGIITVATVNSTSIGSWNTLTTTSTGTPRYTFSGVRAGTIIRFASCTGQDGEITVSGPAGFANFQRDFDNELNVGLGCTPNANDESFYLYCTIAGDYTLKLTAHTGSSCNNLAAGTKNLYWNVTNRPMALATPAYGSSTWNRYYYDGTDHNYQYGNNLGFSATLNFTDNWTTTQPNATANTEGNMCDADNFSTRYWRSQTFSLAGNTSGVYDIRVMTDDGVRMSSNGGSSWNLFNLWDCAAHDNTSTVTLDGSYNFQLEQRECTGSAQAAVTFNCLTAIGGNLSHPSSTNLITLSGHRGIIEYWESSTDGSTWTNIGNAGSTTITGTVGNYYRVRLKSCSNTANSGISFVAPDNYWGVYGFNHTGYTFANITTLTNNTLQGGYNNNTVDITSATQWATTPSSATGYVGSAVTADNHTVIYRRKGFPCREYQIDLDNHNDGVVMYLNGTLIYSLDGCCTDRGVIWQGVLSTTDIVEFRVMENTGTSLLSVNFIEVDNQSATIGASPNPICENQTLNLSSSISGTAPRFTNTVDIAIADFTCYSSYINVTSTLNASQLSSLVLNITHTFTGDIDLTLFAPNGSSIDLCSDNGASGDNFTNTTFSTTGTAITAGTAPFNGTYTPEQAFSTLTGSATGMWRLQICDDGGGDVGNFLDWRLNFPNTAVYNWSGPNSYTSTSQNPSINPVATANAGTYTVNITSSGCTSTNTVAVTVNTVSTALSSVGGNTNLCLGESTTLTVSGGIAGTGSNIYWYNGPNGTGSLLATGTSYTFSPTVTTNLYVRREGSCNNTTDYPITVNVSTLSSGGMVAGDYLWTGTINSDWNDEDNWKVFDGVVFNTAISEPTSTTNVFIDQLSGCVLNTLDICCGPAQVNNLTVRPNGEMEISPNMILEVNGQWINNSGTITNVDISTNSDVEFAGGSGFQTIEGNTSTYFGNLENASFMYVTVETETYVKGTLTMTGSFWLDDRLILGISPTQRGTLVCDLTTVNGWFVGPSYFRRYYAAGTNSGVSGFFPMGTLPSIFYRPVTIEYTTAPTSGGWIEARFIEYTLTFINGLPIMNDAGISITGYMDEGYWEINSGGGLTGGLYSLKLRYDGIGTPTDPSIMRIIKAPDPHTTWEADGTHGGLVSFNSITRTGMSGFSWFVISTETEPLPVELTELSTECKLNGTQIHWTTASENNSSTFEIDRSTDGNLWNNIGIVQAAGNSTQILNYSYMDEARLTGVNYYRLRQIDIDGKEKVYGPISASCFDGLSDDIVVYPNPTNGTFTTEFESNYEQVNCVVELQDVLGKVIQRKTVNIYNGVNQVLFETQGLNPGEYLVIVRTEDELKMVKVVVM